MKRKANRSAGRLWSGGGFTLIELLVVIAVIGILAAMVYTAVTTSTERAKRTSTRALISALDTGIANFRTDFGHVPYDSLTGGSATNDPKWIRRWLLGLRDTGEKDDVGATDVRRNALWNGPYLEVRERSLDPDQQYIFVDAWGKPIYFEIKDPIFNMDRWDIWSKGADGEGSEDMSAFQTGTYEQRRANYKSLLQSGKKVNFDNPGNWQ
jgi:prepilin-type N-terminal cleavage/methylation domain-containing protein